MRFIDNGPSIPDELLLARDQGRVVFFCGAGVSRAKAGLPDFIGLTSTVIDALGVTKESPVRKVLEQSQNVLKNTNVPGLISADRLFSLLEREFSREDIEKEVARALNVESPDLSAHETLIQLATTQTGHIRLVTTNFDRLFDDVDGGSSSWLPSNLPNVSRPTDFDGVVYLHGRVTDDYSASEKDGFILSSAEFGRAYLAESWAADFFKDILRRYIVVFVGYTADDPPVSYLLEALNGREEGLKNIYAFQDGTKEEARAKWQHKGVEAISYDSGDKHKALWDTLEAWAVRAKDVKGWYQGLVDLSQRSPSQLRGFERGMIAHMVSHSEGAKLFAEAAPSPSADWILVFDRECRYFNPSTVGQEWNETEKIDPFNLYCLDSDQAPAVLSDGVIGNTRLCPDGSWDAFKSSGVRSSLEVGSQPTPLVGFSSVESPILDARLRSLAVWIAKQSIEPVVLWWASKQMALHPFLIEQVEVRLCDEGFKGRPDMVVSWGKLFEIWSQSHRDGQHSWYKLLERVRCFGWSWKSQREYLELLKPKLSLASLHGFAPVRKSYDEKMAGRIVRSQIKYPSYDFIDQPFLPAEWLIPVLDGLSSQLMELVRLEKEAEIPSLISIPSLATDVDAATASYYEYSSFLLLHRISKLFDRLAESGPDRAREVYRAWESKDSIHFLRLRVWASKTAGLLPPETVESIFCDELNDEFFLEGGFLDDSLQALKSRWNDMSAGARQQVEARICAGPKNFEGESEGCRARVAHWILYRLHWLNQEGCELECNLSDLTRSLKEDVPDWSFESVDAQRRSFSRGGGSVRTDTACWSLMNLESKDVLTKAEEIRGRTSDILVDAEPFKGLINKHPSRAFYCLKLESLDSKYPEWAWELFLHDEKRSKDIPILMRFVGDLVLSFPDPIFESLLNAVCGWLDSAAERLYLNCPSTIQRVITKLIDAVERKPNLLESFVKTVGARKDWPTSALNSPVYKLMSSLFEDPVLNLERRSLPRPWLNYIERLLSVKGECGVYALTICSRRIDWFYRRDISWTKEHLLAVCEENNEQEALQGFWSGFFWGAKLPDDDLFSVMKGELLSVSSESMMLGSDYSRVHGQILLYGWAKSSRRATRLIGSKEFREFLVCCDESYRLEVLSAIHREVRADDEDLWLNQFKELMTDVWPKQRSSKSPSVAAKLISIVFGDPELFVQIGCLVSSHLVKCERVNLMLPMNEEDLRAVVQKNPELALSLIYGVLPDSVRGWPYRINAMFDLIEQSDNELRKDDRLIELKRRWNER